MIWGFRYAGKAKPYGLNFVEWPKAQPYGFVSKFFFICLSFNVYRFNHYICLINI